MVLRQVYLKPPALVYHQEHTRTTQPNIISAPNLPGGHSLNMKFSKWSDLGPHYPDSHTLLRVV